MYKNPELSAQAKNLRAALGALGHAVTHAQSLELMARAQGSKTLHVAQATKAKQGLDIALLAEQQAAALMFNHLGRYAGNVRGLLESISAGFALEESEGSRAVEAAMCDIFEQDDSPEVTDTFDVFRLSELPAQFERLVARLQASLVKASGAPAPQGHEHALYRGPLLDWRVMEGEDLAELPESHRTRYELDIKRSGHQVYVDIAVPHASPDELEGTDQMSLFIEVNNGRPCVHISNDRYGDQVLTVLATRDGLYLRPDSTDLHICMGACPDDTALAAVQADEHIGPRLPMNHAFIITRN